MIQAHIRSHMSINTQEFMGDYKGAHDFKGENKEVHDFI